MVDELENAVQREREVAARKLRDELARMDEFVSRCHHVFFMPLAILLYGSLPYSINKNEGNHCSNTSKIESTWKTCCAASDKRSCDNVKRCGVKRSAFTANSMKNLRHCARP